MTFVTAGLAIAGLASIAAPILIHMLSRQRRRPIEWGAMRFLLEAFRKHRRRLQIEQLLLLLIRCLVIALIGFALARPLLEGSNILNVGGSRAVFLVIDDGLAAGVSLDEQGAAIRRHVADATELIRTLDVGDAVGLVTAARPARAVLTPPSSDHGSVISHLEDLKPQQAPTDLPGALGLLKQAIVELDDRYDEVLVYMLSEFRAGSAPLSSPLPESLKDVARNVKLLASPPAQGPVTNVQVADLRPLRSVVLPGVLDGSRQVMVRLERHGGVLERGLTQVRLAGDGIENLPPRTVEWAPGQGEAEVEFTLEFAVTGDRKIGLTATIDNDALGADNQRHAVIELRDRLRVLLVDRRAFGFQPTLDRMPAGLWIRRALEPTDDSPVEVVSVEPQAMDISDLRTSDAVVLSRPDLLPDAGWTLLREFVDGGGLLLLVPPGDINVHPWVDQVADDLELPWRIVLETRDHADGLPLASEQPQSELFRMISSDLQELALPVLAFRTLPLDREQSSAAAVLSFDDGTPLLVMGSPGVRPTGADGDDAAAGEDRVSRGIVMYLALAPELAWTNLPSKPLMVPLFQESIRQGLSLVRSSQQLYVGDRPALALGAAVRDLVDPDGDLYPLDAASRPQKPLHRAGLYDLLDQGAQIVGAVAVNIEPPAGRTETQSPAAVTAWLGDSGPWQLFDPNDLGAALRQTQSGSSLAGIILWIVLALVVIETLLARWFSHAFRADVAGGPGEMFGSGVRGAAGALARAGRAPSA